MDKRITLDSTRFIFATNFSGNPANDRFADTRRKCNLVIPDPDQARDLIKQGIKVRETRPRQEDDPNDFLPEYFVSAVLKYEDRFGNQVKYPPKVYLVVGDNQPVLLDEDSIAALDQIRAKNVNVILNAYEYDPVGHQQSLYIRTMYVEQDVDDDPYAARYSRRDEADAF
ncbi:MAG: hypothetical protein RSD95_07750 [Clostridia bacterium]